jgi:endonuclease III
MRHVIRALRARYGTLAGPPTADPFALILFENVAYLATPDARRAAFAVLQREVGLKPAQILAAPAAALASAAQRGILAHKSVEKLRACARIALERFAGDLRSVVARPVDEAVRALQAFPGIGRPGAEKVLLFSGRAALLAPDSNALRVLVRLGLVVERKSYAATYAASSEITRQLPQRVKDLQRAHLLLQHHGRTLCKRSAPRCDVCPLFEVCEWPTSSSRTGRPPRARTGTSPRAR